MGVVPGGEAWAVGQYFTGAQTATLTARLAAAVPGDADGDGTVGIEDFLIVLANWGECSDPCPPACAGDVDADCEVGTLDFLMVLGNWGS